MNTKEQRFSKLVKEYEQTIYAVCYMFSRDAGDLDDLHQEILLRLWQGYDGFEGRSDIKTWIYRVALNYCINFSNKRKREQTKHAEARGCRTHPTVRSKNECRSNSSMSESISWDLSTGASFCCGSKA